MYNYLDDIFLGIIKTGKTLVKKDSVNKTTSIFTKSKVMSNPNADDVVLSAMAQARKKCQQIYDTDKRLHNWGMIEAFNQFKKTNNNDYELLAKIFQNEDLIANGFLHSILKNTNSNNRAIVELFLDQPQNLIGKDLGSKLRSLNFLMCLNRNNPVPKEILTDKKAQSAFWNRAIDVLMDVGKHNKKLMDAGNIMGYGGRYSRGDIVDKKLNIASLNKNFLDDIENLVHGRDYIQHFDMYSDAIKNAKYGDAFSIKGKMFIREADGKFTELGYSEDVFRKLFPPADRFNTCQGRIGDCYFVSLIDAIMNKPEGRNRIYKLFNGSTKDKIVVSKGKNWKHFDFKRLDNEELHVHNKNAFAILEQFAAYNRVGKTGENMAPEDVMKMFRGGQSLNSCRLLLDMGDCERTVNLFAMDEYKIESLIKSGLSKKEAYIQAEKDFINMLKQNINKPDKVITFGTIAKPSASSESLLDDAYDLYSSHGYSIKNYNADLKTVTISNPWNTAIETVVPIKALIKYVNKAGFCCTDISIPKV